MMQNRILRIGLLSLVLILMPCLRMLAIEGIMYESNRMASSIITGVCQDKYGMIWISTDFGLSKFDGYKFENYYHNSHDETSIADNLITSFAATSKKELFIGTRKGLARYDYTSDCFFNYTFPDSIQPRVSSITEMPSGHILVSTAGHGFYVIDQERLEIRKESSFEKHFGSRYVKTMLNEGNGIFWMHASDNRILRCHIKGSRLQKVTTVKGVGKIPVKILSRQNMVFFIFYDEIKIFDKASNSLIPSGLTIPPNITIASAFINGNGDFLLGTSGNGLFIIRNGTKTAVREPFYNKRSNTDDLSINSIMEDKDNNLWLTSPRYGLLLCPMGKKVFNSWNFTYNGKRMYDGVTFMTGDNSGGLLCVLENNGLFGIDSTGKTRKLEGCPNNTTAVFKDSSGTIWVGTWNALYTYNPATSRMVMADDLNGLGTLFITEDHEGRIYYTVFGDGFKLLDRKTGEKRHYSTKRSPKRKGAIFGNDWVGMIFPDSKGLVWMATTSGLWCYDPEKDYFVDLAKGDGMMRETSITSLCETSASNLLIGTTKGLYLWHRDKNVVERLPGGSSLEDMNISCLTRDSDGKVWISTYNGIWQYTPESKSLVSYAGCNGITEDEYCVNSFFQTQDGRIFFGSNGQITYFNPREITNADNTLSDIFLTRFSTLTKTFNPFGDTFSVPWDDNSVTMFFTLFDYQKAENLRYEYRLNGSEWTPFESGSNSLTFTKLKSGTYDLEVRATMGGSYSSSTRNIVFTVEAPWYATTLAKILYTLLLLVAVALGVRFFKRRQESALDEEKMQLLINATHDIRSPLTLILGPIEKLKDLVDKTTVAEDDKKLMDHYVDTVNRNAERLLLLVNQILDVRKIDKKQMRLKCQETDLVTFVNGVCLSFNYISEQRGIDLNVMSSEEKVMAWIDRINFDKVLTNIISNAFKHTFDGGEIRIEISKKGKEVEIRVIDSGSGFGNENIKRLFERFYQGRNTGDSGLSGTGIGLNLSLNIVKLHGGRIEAENRTDGTSGACVIITLPSGKLHLNPEYIYHEEEKPAIEKRVIYQKNRIMIVDDDSELSAYVASELNPWYHIDIYSNGIDALHASLTQNYDLVVSDIVMPGMNGIELLKKIKQNPQTNHIPVVLLSTRSEVSDRLAGFKSGADAYIAKPFNIDELHARIDTLLNNMRMIRTKFSGSQQQEDKVEKVELTGNDEQLMKRVMKSVNSHLGDCDFSVDILAQETGLSRVQLHRKIKEITGVSTGKFIRNIRMEQARRLILAKKVNITQVAYSVGFSDTNYFSTVFKQYYGVKPSEYTEKKE